MNKGVKAILYGVLVWISVTVVWLILTNAPYIGDVGVEIHWGFYYILLIPIVLYATSRFYQTEHIDGILLGLIFVLITAILDAAITLPIFVKTSYMEFFFQIPMYVAMLEMIIIAKIYDYATLG